MKKGILILFWILLLAFPAFADKGWKIGYDHIEFNGNRDDSLAFLVIRRAGSAQDTFMLIDTTGSVWFINYYPKMESLFIDNAPGPFSADKYTFFCIDSLFSVSDSFGSMGAEQGMIFDHFKRYRQRIYYNRFTGDSIRNWTITTFNNNKGPELKIAGEGLDVTGNAYGPKIMTDGVTVFHRLPYFYSGVLDEAGRFEIWSYDSIGGEDSLRLLLQIKGYFAPKLEWNYGQSFFYGGFHIYDSLFIPQFNGGLPTNPSSGFFGADTANDSIIAQLGGTRAVVYPQGGGSPSASADTGKFNFILPNDSSRTEFPDSVVHSGPVIFDHKGNNWDPFITIIDTVPNGGTIIDMSNTKFASGNWFTCIDMYGSGDIYYQNGTRYKGNYFNGPNHHFADGYISLYSGGSQAGRDVFIYGFENDIYCNIANTGSPAFRVCKYPDFDASHDDSSLLFVDTTEVQITDLVHYFDADMDSFKLGQGGTNLGKIFVRNDSLMFATTTGDTFVVTDKK